MSVSLSSLPENGRVVIIGGGPGGTACALALHRLASQMGRRIRITVLESKQFTGERNHNQCVGVLSPPLPNLLEEQLDVIFPRHLCQVEIKGYVLHSSGEQICLDGVEEPSYAVRRVQFDAYMLETVVSRGISVLPTRVEDLEFHADGVVVYTDHTSLEADVVVGAFGLDEGSASLFARLTPYRPPQALKSIVTKYQPEPGSMPEFGPYIHAFLPAHPRIEFGGITPKCSHLTINIAGNAVNAPLMRSFLEHPEVRATLPDGNLDSACGPDELCIFKGRFPCSLARGYYGDRYVMVGDASGLVRAFKGKGATTAVQTAVRAAQVILQHGISREAFHQYYRKANQDIIQDLPYGHGMRTATIFLSRFGLIKFVLRAAQQNPSLRTALFGSVSGHMPYREIIRLSLHPRSVLAVSREMLKLRR